MKLYSVHVLFFQNRRVWVDICARGRRSVHDRRVVAMREISECAVPEFGKQSARFHLGYQIPAHVRNSSVPGKPLHDSRKDTKTWAPGRLFTRFEQTLQTHANTEKRYTAANAFNDWLSQPEFIEGSHHLPEVAHARQNDSLCDEIGRAHV